MKGPAGPYGFVDFSSDIANHLSTLRIDFSSWNDTCLMIK